MQEKDAARTEALAHVARAKAEWEAATAASRAARLAMCEDPATRAAWVAASEAMQEAERRYFAALHSVPKTKAEAAWDRLREERIRDQAAHAQWMADR